MDISSRANSSVCSTCIKITLLSGDTEVVSIILYEPAAVRRQRLTGVNDIIYVIKKGIHGWAGHIARFEDNRWPNRLAEWTTREWTRRQGRPEQDGETILSATRVLRGQL